MRSNDLYTRDIIEPLLVPTRHMVADIFTKALDGPAFYVFRDYILNLYTFSRRRLSAPTATSSFRAVHFALPRQEGSAPSRLASSSHLAPCSVGQFPLSDC
mmetsp:Transcript_27268/g.88065  ORF Transcript_27268/g.88065 Transcript_27268/m.88065 type:complete len:101 (-) Transcript_27268:1635-1937(-)